jgi:peroxiredoxin
VDEIRKRPRLWTIFLGGAIAVLIVQNILLVLKTQEQSRVIEDLNQTVSHLTQIKVGDSLSVFTAMDLDSSFIPVESLMREKKLLLLVFTTWCHYCKENMDEWNRLVKELAGERLEIVGISPDSIYKIRQYKSLVRVDFYVISLANDFGAMKKNKLLSFPKMVIVDTTGTVTRVWSGVLNEERRKAILDDIRRIL